MSQARREVRGHAKCTLLCMFMVAASVGLAKNSTAGPDLNGTWVLNLDESDDPDRKIERAIRDVGGRPDSDGKRGRGRYKGGPVEQEIYDHLIYDATLQITQSSAEVRIGYAEGFERRFYIDGRSRTVSASGSSSGDARDFSFGAWNGQTLNVEAKPRDGGWTQEAYTLESGGTQLRAVLKLKPLLFPAVVEVELVYERAAAAK